MLIDFGNRHTTVIGITQSGKTYAVKKTLANTTKAVLFINTNYQELPNSFIKVTANDSISTIKKALSMGRKINYIPQLDSDTREIELSKLIDMLYDMGMNKKEVYLVVDEVHLFGKMATKKMVQVATTGLSYKIYAIWVSQRPANIDNTLMTQSDKFIIFKTNMEVGYFKNYGIPAEEIKERLEKGGQYSYCIWKDSMELTGAFKV